MSGNNIVEVIKSPAFTAVVITICVIAVMKQAPAMIATIKEMKKND